MYGTSLPLRDIPERIIPVVTVANHLTAVKSWFGNALSPSDGESTHPPGRPLTPPWQQPVHVTPHRRRTPGSRFP